MNIFEGTKEWGKKHAPEIVLILMIVWVTLLVIGTVAEVLDIQAVLRWAIWRPPGSLK